MKVLITARPGVGKSTVSAGLAKRGLTSYDLEEIPGVIRLEDKVTGKPVVWPKGFMDWSLYSWNIQAKPLHDFLESLSTSTVYLSGSGNNQLEFYDLFDLVIILALDDPAVLRHRLETRETKDAGFTQANIDRAVERFQEKNAELIKAGGIVVDNSQPLDVVLDEIEKIVRDQTELSSTATRAP